jgi:acyl dehydratase
VSAVDWSAPFSELAPGSAFRSRGRTITEADVAMFAALSGDLHPLHTDREWAASSRFGERVAHGMLLLSYAVGLVPLDPDRVLALRRVRDATFKRPVTLGQTIHVEGEVASLARLDGETGLVGWRWRIVTDAQLLACRAEVDVLWSDARRRRPQAVAEEALEDLPPGVIPC